MTIPRVLLAAALLILGFMILGTTKTVLQLKSDMEAAKTTLVGEVGSINKGLAAVTKQQLAAEDTLDKVYKLTKAYGRVGKPRVKAVPCLPVQQADPFAWRPTPPVSPPSRKRLRYSPSR